MVKKKKALDTIESEHKMVKLNGKEYYLGRLTNRGLFRLPKILNKLGVDWVKVLEGVDKGDDKKANETLSGVAVLFIQNIPNCEDEFNLLMQSLLKDKQGNNPDLEELANMEATDLIDVLEIFIVQENIARLIRRFFGLMTGTLKRS